MASAQVVITDARANTPAVGGLFGGLSFFLVQRLPQRSSFVDKIQSNGGRVVKTEAQADHIIADQCRKDCPPGSISYKFIDDAIKHGERPDPNDFPAGPARGSMREVGSAIPGKSTRTAFTAEDDKVLWHWVERCKLQGALVKGNEIYKQLEAQNNRHTYQAWRDRYVKKLIDKPPAGVELRVAANAPPSPPTAQDEDQEIEAEITAQPHADGVRIEKQKVKHEHDRASQDAEQTSGPDDDVALLTEHANDIEMIAEDQLEPAWEAWAKVYPHRSAPDWRNFYAEEVRPLYLLKLTDQGVKDEEIKDEAIKDEGVEDEDEVVDGAAAEATTAMTSIELPSGLQNSGQYTESTSSKPQSANSPKRKRETPNLATPTYGRKKQRAADNEIFEQADSDDEDHAVNSPPKPKPFVTTSIHPIEILSDDEDIEVNGANSDMPTSELNRAAEVQLDQEPSRYPDVITLMPTPELNKAAEMQFDHERSRYPDLIPTSELNRDAQAQFDEEVLGITQSNIGHVLMSNLPTSDVNRAADQQLLRESLERKEDPDSQKNPPSTPKQIYSQTKFTAHPGLDTSVEVVESHALTEANLASQQAQHKAQLLRGADLPEDDVAEDDGAQEAYLKFLQDVTKSPGEAQSSVVHNRSAELSQRQPVHSKEPELPFSVLLPDGTMMEPDPIADLPMSSQQEIDDAFEDSMNWPESPKPSERASKVQSQNLSFETQVEYPNLPSQYPEVAQHETMFSRQPAMPAEINYPTLPEQVQIVENMVSSQRASNEHATLIDDESSYVLIDQQPSAESSQLADEDELDLAIPEPEGGWDLLSSSPAKSGHSQRVVQKPAGEPRSQVEVVRANDAFVEISSASSSNSSSISQEEAREDVIRHRTLETQDILNAETQLPNFDMPLPPDSDDDTNGGLPSDPLAPPSSPPLVNAESQRNLARTQKLPDDDVDAYMDKMLLYGYEAKSVIDALKSTSMRPDLAELVLLDEKAGNGLPKDIAGIWSDQEDHVLESGNARGLRRLEEKHTWKECEARLQFLEAWRDEE